MFEYTVLKLNAMKSVLRKLAPELERALDPQLDFIAPRPPANAEPRRVYVAMEMQLVG